jgi:anaerobic ribonucleoside-triphosphate reductase activating protein
VTLRVARFLERSLANGPGERCVVWVAGCSLRCDGCINRELWDPGCGQDVEVGTLASRINAVDGLRGVTLSGGEPLDQAEAVAEFLGLLRSDLDRVLFSGYSREEMDSDPRKAAVLARVDLVVAGRYQREQALADDPWRASSNQTVHALTGRIRPQEVPAGRVEVHIRAGQVSVTGFPGAELLARLKGGLEP